MNFKFERLSESKLALRFGEGFFFYLFGALLSVFSFVFFNLSATPLGDECYLLMLVR